MSASPLPAAQPQQWEILLTNALGHGFDYVAPPELPLREGDFVSVPFGRYEHLGVVWAPGKAN
ncbi:MAG: hypothetical protein K2Q01_06645, partial [Rickettsiales bacterium]|nr:hypothetical protein [Rickettsiales bacterium]